jgi:hypothetical protein
MELEPQGDKTYGWSRSRNKVSAQTPGQTGIRILNFFKFLFTTTAAYE